MPKFIHLRKGDRTQRLVGDRADHVAKTLWEPAGWQRYTPDEPYDAAKAAKAEAKTDKKPAKTDKAAE